MRKRLGCSFPWKVCASTSLENGFPRRDVATEATLQELYDSVPPLAFEGHAGQIDDMVSALETGAEPLVDGAAGRRTLELIMGIYRSAQSGTDTIFPIGHDDPFYRAATMLPLLPRFHEKTRSQANFSSSEISLGRKA